MVSWFVGDRSQEGANTFIEYLASRVAGRIQLTTDGHGMYIEAIRRAFGHRIDYAQLVKTYGQDRHPSERRRYGSLGSRWWRWCGRGGSRRTTGSRRAIARRDPDSFLPLATTCCG